MGVGLAGGGGALGWLAGRRQDSRVPAPHPDNQRMAKEQFAYDISAFEKTDPKHLMYRESETYPVGLERPKRMAVLPSGRLAVIGDRQLKFFEGRVPVGKVDLGRVAQCLLVLDSERLLVGMRDFFQIHDPAGKLLYSSPALGGKTYFTSAARMGDILYLADAGNREIVRADLTGKVIDRFGKKDENHPGFAIPSPYFDIVALADGTLRAANTGRLRVDTYTAEGAFVSSWGEPGMNIDRFCGCCNPAHLIQAPNGDFITSEKGLNRINVYDANGVFKGAVAGPESLVKDKQLARKACEDCTVGHTFDVAVDSAGNVLALDPITKSVRVFSPLRSEDARQG